jgi:hypothetical protein
VRKTPKKGKTPKEAKRQIRRQKIAAKVVAGKPIAEIAREEGISRTWASQEANAPGTRVLIADMIDRHRDEMAELGGLAIKAVREAFEAKKILIDKFGVEVDCGPDHYARLGATKRYIELGLAGRKGAEKEQDIKMTWEMFMQLYERANGNS